MRILINGEPRECSPGYTVDQLLQELKISRERIAVEINLTVIDRSVYHATTLNEGDQIEIISFIGGGGADAG